MDEEELFEERPRWGQDLRAELSLGALSCVIVLLLLGMLFFILREGWSSFAHNGLGWFGSGGNVDNQVQAIFNSGTSLGRPIYAFHAWPLIWGTILVVG